jgi:hypothetical protein
VSDSVVYVRTDVPGSDTPLYEAGEAESYYGNGHVAVRMPYGVISVHSERLSLTLPTDTTPTTPQEG